MLNADFYNFLMETTGAIGGALAAARARTAEPVALPPVLQVRRGFAESPAWFMVQATEFDPEPLTVARLRVRDVYGSERIVQALLELLAGEQWLTRDAHDAYSLTDAGRALWQRVRERQRQLMATLTPLPEVELARLETFCRRLITASLAAHTPPAWCLAHSRRRAPVDAPALVQIVQYSDDFNAFRDDAHMAAWQPLGVSGHAWEAFALVSERQADSAETVFGRLVHRGYARHEYAAALDDLTQRGWLRNTVGDQCEVTAEGRAVRAEAERLTDAYFYAPWSCLSTGEIQSLHDLLGQLRDGADTLSRAA